MAIASVVGVLVAVLELGLIWYAGRLVDLMGAGPATLWSDHGQEIALAALVLLTLRPIVVGANAAVLFSGISTNLLTQARWRAHHHLLGQPVAFFQSDFAGRLANRVLGVGPATGDAGFLVFEAFWQASAFAIATLIFLTGMDWRIAHRLSTIAQMDRIVVLDHGLVAEAGSHSALLARNGLYARFWARQSGGFIGLDA